MPLRQAVTLGISIQPLSHSQRGQVKSATMRIPAPTDTSLRRQLNSLKREQFPWMFDVTKCAAQEAVIDLGSAFRSFFEKRGKYPRFKKRGVHDSFCAANEAGTFRTDSQRIKLPVVGWVRTREADRWFASVMVETDDIKPVVQPIAAVGVDLGITTLATLSSGEVIPGPKAHTALLKRLRRASKAMVRKVLTARRARRKFGQNIPRARRRLARLHARIANIRRDATHKATTMLAKTYRRIGIEDLNVRGMASNRRLARSMMDGGFFEFRRQLEYKARFYGATVVVADRWFPSSKTCSCCGSLKAALALSRRIFECDDCGYEAGRDNNAARNLENMAASFAVTACGEERSGAARKPRVKRASVKQEPDSKPAA
jgi:putative transposase